MMTPSCRRPPAVARAPLLASCCTHRAPSPPRRGGGARERWSRRRTSASSPTPPRQLLQAGGHPYLHSILLLSSSFSSSDYFLFCFHSIPFRPLVRSLELSIPPMVSRGTHAVRTRTNVVRSTKQPWRKRKRETRQTDESKGALLGARGRVWDERKKKKEKKKKKHAQDACAWNGRTLAPAGGAGGGGCTCVKTKTFSLLEEGVVPVGESKYSGAAAGGPVRPRTRSFVRFVRSLYSQLAL